MIKNLQKKFIMITGISLLTLILILLLSINIINIYTNEKNLTHTITVILDNEGELPKYNKIEKHINSNNGTLTRENRVLFYTTRFCVVSLDDNKDISSISSDNISALSDSQIEEYTYKILDTNNSKGWIDDYKYQIEALDDGYMLVILDGSSTKQSNISIFLISISVGFIFYIIILLIIILSSKKAIEPIAKSYEKQKQFITDAGHELKTPLTIISANTEILAMTYGNDEWIKGIEKQSEHMRNLVNNLVSLAKLDENNSNNIYSDFCISDAVYDTAMAFEGVCKNKSKKLYIHVNPNINYSGDESSIRQLISILVDNAVNYCDDNGDIYVNLQKEKQIILSITNTYSKVSSIDLNNLFDRFYRVDKARTRKGHFGLGLSIAEAIVTSHKGKICAKNIDDKFIKFEIKL